MATVTYEVDFGTGSGGPCSWIADPGCCTCWDDYSPDVQDAALAYAATVLWAATGRKFGTCELTVRPCGLQCNDCAQGVYWWGGVWLPYISNGVWRNCWCGDGYCRCEPRCQVYLPGPVTTGTTMVVTQDGAVVPAGSYRVDNGQWLVRTDGECWPRCQDYDADTGDNTMQVAYTRGIAVPTALASATGILACEFVKACQGGNCRLPQRLSTVARQGVQLTYQNIDGLLERGLTGITEVDQVIYALNPYGLKTRLRVSSPDLPVTRQVTTP
jgi:hypothetical protein